MHINITPHFGSTFQRTHATFPTVKGKSGRSPRPREYSEHWMVGWDEDEVADGGRRRHKKPAAVIGNKNNNTHRLLESNKSNSNQTFSLLRFLFLFFFYQSQYKHSTMEGAKTSVCLCISTSMQTFFYIIIFIYRYYTYPTGSVFRVSLCYYWWTKIHKKAFLISTRASLP